jgi:biopolymer transport protein ExbD
VSSKLERAKALRTLRELRGDDQPLPRPEVRADINVTPLVDVVLVLLIIFMVVTPLIASGVAVDLPRTTHHARKPDDGKDIIISVTLDKRMYVGARRVQGAAEVARAVVLERTRSPEKGVFVKGDARAPYGAVREVMEALHEADVQDIVLGTEEQERSR